MLGLAPDRVFQPRAVTGTRGGLLPRRFTSHSPRGLLRAKGGLVSVTLSVSRCPGTPCLTQGILSCGARTFLSGIPERLPDLLSRP